MLPHTLLPTLEAESKPGCCEQPDVAVAGPLHTLKTLTILALISGTRDLSSWVEFSSAPGCLKDRIGQ